MSEVVVEPRRVALTIQFYRKTQEGQEMVASGELFVLGGDVYQGYNMNPVLVHERQVTDKELEQAHDVDGSKEKVWVRRRGRLGAAKAMRDKELEDRDRINRAKRRDELELQKLERELAPGPPVPVADLEVAVACQECGKEFANSRKLQGHMMGAHRHKE